MEITFSNIDNRKQKKKKNFIHIMPPHTQIGKKNSLAQERGGPFKDQTSQLGFD